MKVLISFIGNTDPVRGDFDGPMLHIVRHYQPNYVYLLLTEKMQQPLRKQFILESIQSVSRPKMQVLVVEMIDLNLPNPSLFKNFGLGQIINQIILKHPSMEIIANISSGTPQMMAALALDVVVNDRSIKMIQVKNPEPNNGDIKKIHEHDYDFSQNVDTLEEADNRCIETDLFTYKIAAVKQQLIDRILRYDYANAKSELEKSTYLKSADVLALVKTAYECDKLHPISNPNLLPKYQLIRSQTTKEIDVIMHYYQSWKLEFLRGNYLGVVLRMTPLFYHLLLTAIISHIPILDLRNLPLWEKLRTSERITASDLQPLPKDLRGKFNLNSNNSTFFTSYQLITIYKFYNQNRDILTKFDRIRTIEEDTRHVIAHQIDMAVIKQSDLSKSAQTLMTLIESLIDELFQAYKPNINFDFFDQLNQLILLKIKEIEE